MKCKNHQDQDAAFQCMACKSFFCPSCVVERTTKEGMEYNCKECVSKHDFLKPKEKSAEEIKAEKDSKPIRFYAYIPTVFIFPFKLANLGVLAGGFFFSVRPPDIQPFPVSKPKDFCGTDLP